MSYLLAVPPSSRPTQAPGLNWLATAGVIGAAILTVRPLGAGGWALAVAALLPLNSLLLAARHIPIDRLSGRPALIWLTFAVIAANALVAASESGTAYLFCYFLAGHAGVRLAFRPAVLVAALCGVLCAAVMYFGIGPGAGQLPWPVGLSVGLPVLIGMNSRSRREAVEAVLAAAQAEARSAQAEARSASLAERARIARDVHDVLAHSLAGVNMQLELADALLETGDLERVRIANERAHSLVRDSLRQAQWTVHTLREDALPLVGSLTAMLESSGHRDVLDVSGDDREVPALVVQNLLRIAQESLTNAARHAPGGAVQAKLEMGPESVMLRVTNRPGTRAANSEVGSGMGLVGMRERVALLKGTLVAGPVTDGPDQGGWRVTAVVPL